MAFQITFKPSDKIIFAEAEDSILTAAIHQGVNIPYGCRNGACGACKAKVLSGQVHYDSEIQGLSTSEQQQGFALLCCAKADSDIQLECRELTSQAGFVPKIVPVRVEQLQRLCEDVMAMRLKLPVNQSLQFHAGQYIEFILKDGTRRAFSLANPSSKQDQLELHLRHVQGGKFTDYVFNELQEKTIMRIEGPFGNFYFRNELTQPVIFVAGGTGFAPIKGMIEDLIERGQGDRNMRFYWGVRGEQDLYMRDLVLAWQNQLPNFQFIPVLSQHYDSQWQGRTGLVHEAVLQDISDFADYQVYCCGAPVMVQACQTEFLQRGLPEQHFFADIFSYASAPNNPA